ncbi:MAG: CCA tRNA nucleotidyltransferase [Anaerovorax sp.]
MILLNLKLNAPTDRALKMLFFTGFRGYLVGGSVRDLLLKRKPKNINICTNALPENVLQTFVLFKTDPTDMKRGIIRVRIHSVPVEISTYRMDGHGQEVENPEQIVLTDQLSLDLVRRDFTINAMAYNQALGLVDYHNGYEDLKGKLIRCVGDPFVRLGEDPLRIIRGIRFASVLKFEIEAETKKAIFENKELVRKIPNEVLGKELLKILKGPNSRNVLEEYSRVINVFVPELRILNPTEIKEMASVVSQLPSNPSLKFAGFLYYLEETCVRSVLTRFYLKKTLVNEICILIESAKKPLKPDSKTIKYCIKNYNIETLQNIFLLKKGYLTYSAVSNEDYSNQDKNMHIILELVQEILKNHGCCKIQDLDIDGEDLSKLGIGKDGYIGKIMEKLLDLVIEGKLQNKKKELINYVKKYF